MTADWKGKAEKKRAEVKALIPKDWILPDEELSKYDESTPVSVLDVPKKYLSDEELHITEDFTPRQLVNSLAEGKLKAIDVVKAFSHRAVIATQLTNCCTELLFEYSYERAEFLDKYLEENGKPFGPLHGLPISLKDMINIPGYDSTLGYIGFIGNASTRKDYSFFEMIISLGAVPFVKTNVPQTLMIAESDNNLFGRVLNPNKLTLTGGGSSGGEGSLIKQRGSLVGIGTDIGGSIRIPALCNGVYGFRSTASRIPNTGQTDASRRHALSIGLSTGPLSVDLDGVEMVTEAIINSELCKSNPRSLFTPWNSKLLEKPMKIGWIVEDPDFPVHPPMKRFFKEIEDKLIAKGHTIVKLEKYPSFNDSWNVIWKIFHADPKNESLKHLEEAGEPLVKALTPGGFEIFGYPPTSIEEVLEYKGRATEIFDKWIELYKDFDLDCIVSPACPGVAPLHDHYGIAPYTTQWNLVDFPALIVPYGKVEDVDEPQEVKETILTKCYTSYDKKEDFLGAPGHIQVVGNFMQDEKVLQCAKLIEQSLYT